MAPQSESIYSIFNKKIELLFSIKQKPVLGVKDAVMKMEICKEIVFLEVV